MLLADRVIRGLKMGSTLRVRYQAVLLADRVIRGLKMGSTLRVRYQAVLLADELLEDVQYLTIASNILF